MPSALMRYPRNSTFGTLRKHLLLDPQASGLEIAEDLVKEAGELSIREAGN